MTVRTPRPATVAIAILLVICLAGPATAVVPADTAWVGTFGDLAPGSPGLDRMGVRDILSSGSSVILAGQFTIAGLTPLAGLARWTGENYVPAADPLLVSTAWPNVVVLGLALDGGLLYAAGAFSIDADDDHTGIAVWDGSAWSAVGGGIGSRADGVVIANGDIYVYGTFTSAGPDGSTVPVEHVARWDGANWASLQSAIPTGARVYDLLHDGADLYATGDDGIEVRRWDGSQWVHAGTGFPPQWDCQALGLWQGDLIAGGRDPGDWEDGGVYRLSGGVWSPLGPALKINFTSAIREFAVFDGSLYAAGSHMWNDETPLGRLARWTGTTWEPASTGDIGGSPASVYTAAGADDHLWVGGDFTSANGLASSMVALHDGTDYVTAPNPNQGLDAPVRVMAKVPGGIVVAGEFTATNAATAASAGTEGLSGALIAPLNGIALWDGAAWSALGDGFDGAVYGLAADGATVWAGGAFANSGASPMAHVARWDGAQWNDVGGGTDDVVYAIHRANGNVYAGGDFDTAGATPANRIARWDGAQWHPLGGGVSGRVFAIATLGSDVFAGGAFVLAEGNTANRIARFDGTQWSALGTGATGPVHALAVWQGELYAGGEFGAMDGVTVNRVARWDGVQWHGLAGGVNAGIGHGVFGLFPIGGELFIAGEFDLAGGVAGANLARWDGSVWSGFGSGVDARARAFAVLGGVVYVGGEFGQAGGTRANHIAGWREDVTSRVAERVPAARSLLAPNYPNPFNPSTAIPFEVSRAGRARLVIYDALGRTVRTLVDRRFAAPARYTARWDGRDDAGRAMPSGVYFVRFTSAGGTATRKLVLVR